MIAYEEGNPSGANLGQADLRFLHQGPYYKDFREWLRLPDRRGGQSPRLNDPERSDHLDHGARTEARHTSMRIYR